MAFLNKVIFSLLFGIILQCFAESSDNRLMTVEATRMKVFEILYPQQLKTLEQKRIFVKKHYKYNNGYETFIFPNQTIDSVYNAYVAAYPKDNFGVNVLHKDLPKINKAFRADSNSERTGYVLMYIWSGDKKLSITNTRIEDDNLCGKELLELEEKKGQTILKTNFEQYCF